MHSAAVSTDTEPKLLSSQAIGAAGLKAIVVELKPIEGAQRTTGKSKEHQRAAKSLDSS
jgi:hypothetical protein